MKRVDELQADWHDAADGIVALWMQGKLTDKEADERLLDSMNHYRRSLRRYLGLSPEPKFEEP